MGYIYLAENVKSDHTIEVLDKGITAFVMDIDVDGCLVGVEVFNASKRFSAETLSMAEDITAWKV